MRVMSGLNVSDVIFLSFGCGCLHGSRQWSLHEITFIEIVSSSISCILLWRSYIVHILRSNISCHLPLRSFLNSARNNERCCLILIISLFQCCVVCGFIHHIDHFKDIILDMQLGFCIYLLSGK